MQMTVFYLAQVIIGLECNVKFRPEFSNILSWCTRNCLKLSESKSKTLLIGSNTKLNNVNYNCSLCLANNELEFVEQFKYLGITLDKHMSLNPLLTDFKKKVVGQLLKLRKLHKMITTKCAILIYKQTVLPLLDYAVFLLHSCNVSDTDDLQVLQNDALWTC